MQGFSTPATSASVTRTLFPAHSSLGIPHNVPLDLGRPVNEEVVQQRGGLLSGWMCIPDPNGRRFYYNPQTQESQWELYC